MSELDSRLRSQRPRSIPSPPDIRLQSRSRCRSQARPPPPTRCSRRCEGAVPRLTMRTAMAPPGLPAEVETRRNPSAAETSPSCQYEADPSRATENQRADRLEKNLTPAVEDLSWKSCDPSMCLR